MCSPHTRKRMISLPENILNLHCVLKDWKAHLCLGMSLGTGPRTIWEKSVRRRQTAILCTAAIKGN
jgi:hypothetical protein